ncbi:hypothetical protein [Azospirillum argentinense]|uniref:hypothetical protein n=1 Tax=Azospirillum argentinense TaxID=2970906 RepID=UPI0010C05ECA|nr:hypothetical protein [Azospirillum argentinense]
MRIFMFTLLLSVCAHSAQAAEKVTFSKKHGKWTGECSISNMTDKETCKIILDLSKKKPNAGHFSLVTFADGIGSGLVGSPSITIAQLRVDKNRAFVCQGRFCDFEVNESVSLASQLYTGKNVAVVITTSEGVFDVEADASGYRSVYDAMKKAGHIKTPQQPGRDT